MSNPRLFLLLLVAELPSVLLFSRDTRPFAVNIKDTCGKGFSDLGIKEASAGVIMPDERFYDIVAGLSKDTVAIFLRPLCLVVPPSEATGSTAGAQILAHARFPLYLWLSASQGPFCRQQLNVLILRSQENERSAVR